MAVVGWILLGILALILLVLILPVGIRVEYLQTWQIHIRLFGVIPVMTLSGDDPKNRPETTDVTVTPPPSEKEEKDYKLTMKEQFKLFYKQEGVKGVFTLFKALLGITKGAFRRVAHSLVISRLQLCMTVGGGQADKAAERYGQMCSIVFPLVTALSSEIHMRKPQVRIQPDFLSENVNVRFCMTVYIFPLGIVWAGLVALVKLIGVWSGVTKVAQAASEGSSDPESKKI